MRKAATACVAAMLIAGLMPGLPQENVSSPAATPVKHLVVIFDENVSFDHYFATYPMRSTLPTRPHSRRLQERPG